MSEDAVLLTSEENPIYFNASPVQEDEVRLSAKYRGKCLFELYETSEFESPDEAGKTVKELARYVVVWDEEYGQPLTIMDGSWVEGQGCVSNAVVAPGTTDDVRKQYADWFQMNFKEEQGPIGVGYDGYTVGVASKEVAVERDSTATTEKAKEAIQSIFDAYLTKPQ